MDDNKIPFGLLDTSAFQMEYAAKNIKMILDGERFRMKDEEIKKIKKYLRRVSFANKQIRDTLSKFELLIIKK